MNSMLWLQSWILFIACCCLCWPNYCTMEPVIYDYDNSDDLSENSVKTIPYVLTFNNNKRMMDNLIEAVPPFYHHENRRSVLSSHRHRQEKSKRRLSAGEILQELNRLMATQRKNYVRGRLKGMRFGVSRKRSAPNQLRDQLPQLYTNSIYNDVE